MDEARQVQQAVLQLRTHRRAVENDISIAVGGVGAPLDAHYLEVRSALAVDYVLAVFSCKCSPEVPRQLLRDGERAASAGVRLDLLIRRLLVAAETIRDFLVAQMDGRTILLDEVVASKLSSAREVAIEAISSEYERCRAIGSPSSLEHRVQRSLNERCTAQSRI